MKKSSLIRGLAAAALLVVAQFAQAHAYPQQRTPEQDTTVSGAPQQVSIEFNNGIEPAFSSITVTDAQGKQVTRGKPAFAAGDKKLMKIELAAPGPGVYTVTWVAVADDGHRTQGHYMFTIK
jgi:methionine-rich copper-binding protein CopC